MPDHPATCGCDECHGYWSDANLRAAHDPLCACLDCRIAFERATALWGHPTP